MSTDKRLLGFAFRRVAVSPLPPHLSGIETLHSEQAFSWRPQAVSRQFLTEDGASLRDSISIAFGEDATAVLRHFESLRNSTSRIVQRKLSLEVFNLFRFGNTQLANLMVALTDDLVALNNDAAAVTVELSHTPRREFIVSVPAYHLRWHTFTYRE